MWKRLVSLLALAVMFGTVTMVRAESAAPAVEISEFTISDGTAAELRLRWGQQLIDRYGVGAWAPMRFDLGNEELALLGLPSKAALLANDYELWTRFDGDRAIPVARSTAGKGGGKNGGGDGGGSDASPDTPVAAYAGAGFFGIRPGAWLLVFSGDTISLCSMAHVYGSPGAYDISTAGHCGKTGDIAAMVGLIGGDIPVILEIGKFGQGTGDGGIGRDWALIDIYATHQALVTPTMAFWGGPFGMYEKNGSLASLEYAGRFPSTPSVSVEPDPFLAQQVVHYGHGLGLGTGVGTPRTGTAIDWRPDYFTFFGAITPGDSGSGTNTVTGDSVGAQREAAGINTHIYLDGLEPFKTGTGYLAGTRATLVPAPLANGQLLAYPAPIPILP